MKKNGLLTILFCVVTFFSMMGKAAASSRTLGPIGVELISHRFALDGGRFSLTVGTSHRSGDYLSFAVSAEKGDFDTTLKLWVSGADTVGARSIELLSSAGLPLLVSSAGCVDGSVCLLTKKYSPSLSQERYVASPSQSADLWIRLRYVDGSLGYSRLRLNSLAGF